MYSSASYAPPSPSLRALKVKVRALSSPRKTSFLFLWTQVKKKISTNGVGQDKCHLYVLGKIDMDEVVLH